MEIDIKPKKDLKKIIIYIKNVNLNEVILW